MHDVTLLILVLIPLVGSVGIFLLKEEQAQLAKQAALGFSLVEVVYALVVLFSFDTSDGAEIALGLLERLQTAPRASRTCSASPGSRRSTSGSRSASTASLSSSSRCRCCWCRR